jgi:predicted nucleotidyltransferase
MSVKPQQPKVDEVLIQEIVRQIVGAFHPRRIILFGSRANGKTRAGSDVDLLVEMEAFADEPRWKRRIRVDEIFGLRWWPMDILVYSPEELAQQRGSLASIVSTVEKEGRVLYERRNT